VDVPTNAIVVAVTPFANPQGVVRLLDDQGDPVPGTTASYSVGTTIHGWLVFTPLASLAANTTHSIEIDGMISSTFTTGDSEATDAPPFDSIVAVEPALIAAGDEPSPCWRYADSLDELTIRLSPLVSAVSHIIVDVWPAQETTDPFRVLVPVARFASANTIVMSTDDCGVAGPELVVDQEYCVSVTVYDTFGNASPTREACSGATACVGDSPTGRCATTGGCSAHPGVPGWLALLLGLLPLRRRRTLGCGSAD
jgi:uncharacterized protein (TIGR03382 family)